MKRKASYTSKTSSKKGKFSKSQRSYIRKAVSKSAELKYFDTYTSITAPATVTLLNGITQGAEYNQRIGRHSKIQSVSLKGSILSTSTGAGQIYRWWLVWDKQSNGSTPSFTDVLTANSAYAEKNVAVNADRFTILRTGLITSPLSGNSMDCNIDCYVKVGRDSEFGTALVPPTHGALLFLCSGQFTSDLYAYVGSRVRFTDP